MKIALLGGNGFIGCHLSNALVAEGHSVTIFDRPGTTEVYRTEPSENLTRCEGDFLNPVDVARAINGCEVVFHLVSTTLPSTSNIHPINDAQENLIGSIQMLEEARKCGVKRVIFISSGGTVYGRPNYTPIDELHPTNPICSYGIVKLAIEKYLALYRELYDLDYMVLRLSNPFGEGQSVDASQGLIAVIIGRAIRGQSVEIWGDGSTIRDYVFIADAIDALVTAIDYNGLDRTFNIGSGQGVSILDVLSVIEEVTGLTPERKFLPSRKVDVAVNVLAIERAREELQWKPTTKLKVGVRHLYDWLIETL
jgi:UDP-glucose 4-epimerase